MRRTAILKNNSTAEKRREEEAFALKSIAHYCFVEIKNNCGSQWVKIFIMYKRVLVLKIILNKILNNFNIYNNFKKMKEFGFLLGEKLIRHTKYLLHCL